MLPEVHGNAIRAAESGRPGAAFMGLPKDVGLAETEELVPKGIGRRVRGGGPNAEEVELARTMIQRARKPLVLLGLQSSEVSLAESLKRFLAVTGLPYIATFQGAGAWAEPNSKHQYAGRVGLFRNQPADLLLDDADLVLTVGFDPFEYDACAWNLGKDRPLIAIDSVVSDQDRSFLPHAELVGDIGLSLNALVHGLSVEMDPQYCEQVVKAALEVAETLSAGPDLNGFPVHPLHVISELQKVMTVDTTLALDVGSHYIWMNRYFPAARPRQVLVSNGQQTLGVALPWAIAVSLLRPEHPVITVSGDGGFLFSAMELETARRVGVKFVHLIWNSASYDMVEFQEIAHYGDTAGVALGNYDVVKFAESFGCKGYRITAANQLGPVLKEALAADVPVLIDVPIDYSDNPMLMKKVRQDFLT
jgi:acetolactate synthase-1/2/3 large subunit